MRRATNDKTSFHFIAGLVFSLIFTVMATAETKANSTGQLGADTAATMIILDASGSMWGPMNGRTKFDQAREVIENYLTTKDPNQDVGLTVYGHRREKDCNDIELVIPPGENAEWVIRNKLRGLKPKGKTPLTASVLRAARDLGYQQRKANIVLVTDGIETCGLDPCQAATSLENAGVDFTAHVIGFDIDERQRRTLDCLARNTGGTYIDAKDANELENAFDRIEEELRRENSDLRTQLDDLRLKYARALQEIDDLRAEIARLRAELERVKRQRESLRGDVAALKQKNNELTQRLNQLERLLSARDREVLKLAGDLDREREFAKELERSKNQTIAGLEDALKKSREDAAKRLGTLNSELIDLKDEIDRLKRAHAEETDRLTADLLKANDANAKLSGQIDDFAKANQELAAEVSRQDDIIARLRDAKGLSDDQRENLKQQIASLSDALKNSEKLADDLTRELAKLAADNANKDVEIENLKNLLSTEQGDAAQAIQNEKEKVAALRNQLDRMQDLLRGLQDNLATKNAEADSLAEKLAAVEAERDDLSTDVASLDQDNRDKDLEIERLKAKLAEQVSARDALGDQLGNVNRLFDQSQGEFGKALDDANREIARLNSLLSDEADAKKAIQDGLVAKSQDLIDRDRELEDLRKRLADEAEKAEAASVQAEDAKQEADAKVQQVQALNKDAEQRERDIAKLNDDLENSRGELDKLQGLMDETNALMAAALAAFEKQRKELEAKLAGMQGRNEVLVKEVAGLNAINDERLRKEALRRTQFDEINWTLPEGFPEIDLNDLNWTVTSLGQTANYKTSGEGTDLRLPQTPGVYRIDVTKDEYSQTFEVEVDPVEVKAHNLFMAPALMKLDVKPEIVSGDAALIISNTTTGSLSRYAGFGQSPYLMASAGSYALKGLVTNAQTTVDIDLAAGQVQPVLLDFPVGVVQLAVSGDDVEGASAAVVRWQLRGIQGNGVPINGSGAKARVAVAEGDYRLLITAGNVSRTQVISVTRGETSVAQFEISSANLALKISTPTIMLNDALAWSLEDPQGVVIQSGADRMANLRVAAGDYNLVVNMDGTQIARPVTVSSEGQTTLEIDLQLGKADITPLNPDSSSLFASPVRWILTTRNDDGTAGQRRRLSSTNDMLSIVLKPGTYRLNGLSGQKSGFAEFTVAAGEESEVSVVFE